MNTIDAKVIAKGGTWATQTNLQEGLLELHIDAVPGRRLEMGFSYRKGESKPARFMAGEEWPSSP